MPAKRQLHLVEELQCILARRSGAAQERQQDNGSKGMWVPWQVRFRLDTGLELNSLVLPRRELIECIHQLPRVRLAWRFVLTLSSLLFHLAIQVFPAPCEFNFRASLFIG